MWRKVAVSTGSAAGIYLFVPTVHAADSKTSSSEGSPVKKTCKAKDLPLYGEPQSQVVLVEEPATDLEKKISIVRRSVWGVVDTYRNTTEWFNHKYEVSKAHTNDLVTYLQEDPGALPRAAIITVSGLGGVVAGYRGGFLRKFFFATTGMLTASAVCYPPQAMDIGRAGWDKIYNSATGALSTSPAAEPKKEKPISEKIVSEVDKSLDKLKEADSPKKEENVEKKEAKPAGRKPKEDHGMSKKEDKDLYTTRGN